MINLDEWTRIYMLRIFEELEEARKDLNKNIHVMEFSNAILSRNIPNKNISITEVKKQFFKLFPNAKEYNNENNIVGIYYINAAGKLLLITGNFTTMQKMLSTLSTALDANLDVGHTSDFGREDKNTVLGHRIKQTLMSTGTLSKEQLSSIFDRYDRKLSNIHAPYKVNFGKSSSLASTLVGKFNFIYTVPQDSKLNRNILGAKEGRVARLFVKYLTKGIAELLDVKTSPSIMDMMSKQQSDAFLTGKVKEEKYDAKKSGRFTFKENRGLANKINIVGAKTKGQTPFTSLLALQGLLNLRLHDQIKINMGKGRSKQILNYRTGRFAKSAEVTAVAQGRKEFVDVFYTYQRNPYDTFLPGGRLYKPGRDPRNIIGRSIRQLAIQAVGNNFKVRPLLQEGNR